MNIYIFFSLQSNFEDESGVDCVGREIVEQIPLQNLIRRSLLQFSSLYHFGSFIIIVDKLLGEISLLQSTKLGLRTIQLSWLNFKAFNFIGCKIAELQRTNSMMLLGSETVLLNLGYGVKIYVTHRSEGTQYEISRLNCSWESMTMTADEYLMLYELSAELSFYNEKTNTGFIIADCVV